MVRLGYVSGNRMSNLRASNIKLRDRAVRIVMAETGVNEQTATSALESSKWVVKYAVRQIGKPKIHTDGDE